MQPEDRIPVPAPFASLRRYAMDGALLLFDRDTGLSALCDGEETAGLCRRAPRVVQFAITNACDLRCGFCSRHPEERSAWTAGGAFRILADLAAAGALEVAFGGGEPFLFRDFAALAARLYDETPLAVGVTTNGRRLDDATLDRLRGKLSQVRLSAYDDNGWRETCARLSARRVRFGVNWLLTPARAASLEDDLFELAELGCRDALLLAYNGDDASLHLPPGAWPALARRVALAARALGRRMALKLDVCWGSRMARVPQLFGPEPCAAGADFVVITSEGRVRPCSFHHESFAAGDAEGVLRVWREERGRLAAPARAPGCAREPDFGYARLAPPRRALPLAGAP